MKSAKYIIHSTLEVSFIPAPLSQYLTLSMNESESKFLGYIFVSGVQIDCGVWSNTQALMKGEIPCVRVRGVERAKLRCARAAHLAIIDDLRGSVADAHCSSHHHTFHRQC